MPSKEGETDYDWCTNNVLLYVSNDQAPVIKK